MKISPKVPKAFGIDFRTFWSGLNFVYFITQMAINITMDKLEMLLVEENDPEITVWSLKKHPLVNQFIWLKDGTQTLDFLFAKGKYDD